MNITTYVLRKKEFSTKFCMHNSNSVNIKHNYTSFMDHMPLLFTFFIHHCMFRTYPSDSKSKVQP